MLFVLSCYFFLKQDTAYDVRIVDWSSDVCSSDLLGTDLDLASGRQVEVLVCRRQHQQAANRVGGFGILGVDSQVRHYVVDRAHAPPYIGEALIQNLLTYRQVSPPYIGMVVTQATQHGPLIGDRKSVV